MNRQPLQDAGNDSTLAVAPDLRRRFFDVFTERLKYRKWGDDFREFSKRCCDLLCQNLTR